MPDDLRQIEPSSVPEWYFNDPEYSDARYGNFANTEHLIVRPFRFTPQSSLKWEVGLREDKGMNSWNKFYQRGARSFDETSSLRSRSDKSLTSTDSKCPDREKTSLPNRYLRESSNYACNRSAGCEGSSASQWRHLFVNGSCREYIGWATTLRGKSDVRIDDGIVEMLGRKKLHFKPPRDSIVASDPKLLYIG